MPIQSGLLQSEDDVFVLRPVARRYALSCFFTRFLLMALACFTGLQNQAAQAQVLRVGVPKLDRSVQRTVARTVPVEDGTRAATLPVPLTFPEVPPIAETSARVGDAQSAQPILVLGDLPISEMRPPGYDRTPAYIASPYSAYHRDYYLPTRYNPNYDRAASDPPPYPPRTTDWRPSGKLWYSARSAPWYYGYWYYPRHVGPGEVNSAAPCPDGAVCTHQHRWAH